MKPPKWSLLGYDDAPFGPYAYRLVAQQQEKHTATPNRQALRALCTFDVVDVGERYMQHLFVKEREGLRERHFGSKRQRVCEPPDGSGKP